MAGKTGLAKFIVSREDKIVNNVLTTAWEMENANETSLDHGVGDGKRK